MDNKKTYILDLNNISQFVFGDANDRTHDTEITEIYEQEEEMEQTEDGVLIKRNPQGPLTLSNRTIREVKGSDDNGHFNVKYDMVKMFITLLADEALDDSKLTLGQNLVLNTMLSYGLIKEINE